MHEILIATGNAGKLREYRDLLGELPVQLLGLHDVGLANMTVDETGHTFTANAMLKARAYALASGKATIADDSGLCVDALNGAPGVQSARYAGADATDAQRRAHLLDALRDVAEGGRSARFVCVIALVDPMDGMAQTVEGVCEGHIALAESDGGHGFGYDAVFVPSGYGVTFADLDGAAKHTLSHRGAAARALLPLLRARVGE